MNLLWKTSIISEESATLDNFIINTEGQYSIFSVQYYETPFSTKEDAKIAPNIYNTNKHKKYNTKLLKNYTYNSNCHQNKIPKQDSSNHQFNYRQETNEIQQKKTAKMYEDIYKRPVKFNNITNSLIGKKQWNSLPDISKTDYDFVMAHWFPSLPLDSVPNIFQQHLLTFV